MENFDADLLPFFEDDQFIKWVADPDDATDRYWEVWMNEHPDRVDDLLHAKQYAADLAATGKPLHAEQVAKKMWNTILSRIEPQTKIPDYTKTGNARIYRVAAAIAGLCLLACAYYYFTNNKQVNPEYAEAGQIAGSIVKDTLNRVNKSARNQVVYLVDGSKVTLLPGSSIRHTVFLQKDKREVFLDGDAFFEVAKDPNRPFYVYAHDIELKVLGTSFKVTTNRDNGNITVVVRTGKVSVYKHNNRSKAEFILTPNQRIMYAAQTQSITKTDLDSSRIQANVKPEAHAINFNFEETAVTKIFHMLEEGYGIKIVYDEKVFSKCIITTALNDEPFEEKLKIICTAVNAAYHVGNNQVFIEGSGCK